jgi:zinc protease
VTINATLQAGGVHEPIGRPGLAWLVGRVLDRGTVQRTATTIAEEFDDRGVALRIASSRHTTALSCTCLAEDFADVLALVLDIARNATFRDEEVTKRRVECISAIRQDEDNTAVRAVESLFELMYGDGHPYGRRAKGTVESVESLTSRDLLAFHSAWFVPSAMSLAIVGDVASAEAIDQAARALEGWVGRHVDAPSFADPKPAAERRQRIIDVAGKAQSDIAYGFTAIKRRDPRYDAYFVMNNILGQFGLGGRLGENIRERQGMAYYAFSALDPSVGVGPLVVRAGVDPRNVARTIDAIDHEVRMLGADGPTAAELAETQQFLIGSIPRTLETNAGIASFLQSEEQFGLGLDYDRRLADDIRAVTLDAVRAAAAELLNPDHASVAVAGPVS